MATVPAAETKSKHHPSAITVSTKLQPIHKMELVSTLLSIVSGKKESRIAWKKKK
jgi:hypothetical protein